ncbi:YggT family protein [Thermovibrio sp.]
MAELLRSFLHLVVELLTWFIVITSLLTFLPPYKRNSLINRLIDLLDLLLSPLRKVIPPVGGLDITPFIAIIILQLLDGILRGM